MPFKIRVYPPLRQQDGNFMSVEFHLGQRGSFFGSEQPSGNWLQDRRSRKCQNRRMISDYQQCMNLLPVGHFTARPLPTRLVGYDVAQNTVVTQNRFRLRRMIFERWKFLHGWDLRADEPCRREARANRLPRDGRNTSVRPKVCGVEFRSTYCLSATLKGMLRSSRLHLLDNLLA